MNNPHVSTGTRIGSMIMDHCIMTLIALVCSIPMMLALFGNAFNITHEPAGPGLYEGPYLYLGLLGFALYFCKDCIGGRSLAKRATSLQVVRHTTGVAAAPFRCLVRNLFCIIWPVELVATFISPERRLGDRVAGTRVAPFEKGSQQPAVHYKQVLLSLIMAFGVALLSLVPLIRLASAPQRTAYIPQSYNAAESHGVERLLTDSLGAVLDTADVRVYDRVKGGKLKYISIILRLHVNYLDDAGGFKDLQDRTDQLLQQRYAAGTFAGQAKYYYRTSNSIRTRTASLGTIMQEEKRQAQRAMPDAGQP